MSYFRFVYPRYQGLSESEIDEVTEHIVGNLDQYLGHVFEDICHEYVLKHGYRRVGRWWSGPEEIDLVATDDESMLLAECKYRHEPTDADLIFELITKAKSVDGKGLRKKYALFSKSGFTKTAELRTKTENVELYVLKNMF